MQDVPRCPECKVPELITREHLWLNNGDIVQKRVQSSRLAFIECENTDPIFKSISEIIGEPIEKLIFDIASREDRIYMSRFISSDMKELLRSLKPGNRERAEECRRLIEAANRSMVMLAGIMGMGKYEIRSFRYEGDEEDYSILWVTEPYSAILVAGTNNGYIGAMMGYDSEVDWSEISEGLYEFVSRRARSGMEVTGGFKLEKYTHREGDIVLERCGSCGGPRMLAEYEWDSKKGIIRNQVTGRRMALLGSHMLDPLLKELEKELGERVSRAAVEAERRFMHSGFYSVAEARDPEKLRAQIALRGLGNMKEIKVDKRGVRIEMVNTILPLTLVGFFQGGFELAFNVESYVEWELARDGALSIEVVPR
jgi:hypothetical protein